jgi:hypothetical protein
VRRRARWFLWLAAALVVLGAAGRLALPAGLRWVVARQLRAATGRAASVDDVRLNLGAGRVQVTGVRLSDRQPGPPLLELPGIDLRIHWASLLRGVLRLRELALTAPTIRLVRTGPGELNVSDLLAPRGAAEPAARGLPYVVERFRVTGGQVSFEDRVLSPARTVAATAIQVDLEHVSTLPGEGAGRGTASLVLAGAPLALAVEELGLAPFRAHARVTLDALDLAPLWAYVPEGGALRPEGGRATLRLGWLQDAAGARLDGELAVTDATVRGAGQTAAVVEIPRLTLTARDVTRGGDGTTVGRLELAGEPTVVDGSVSPPRRYAVRPLRATVEGASLTPGRPGRVSLDAGLPGGARLTIRGTADLGARTARLAVDLAGVDAASLAPYIPRVSPVSVARGRLATALDVAYEAPARVTVTGEVSATGLDLVRRDRAEPFIHHPRLRLGLQDAAWRDGALAIRRLTLVGFPTVTDSTASPPLRAEFTRLALVADDVTWPSRGPARVRLDGTVRDRGRAIIAGTFDPQTLATDVRATLVDVDLVQAAGYLPPASPVTLSQGRLGGQVGVRFDRPGGLRVGADGAVADLVLRRADGPGPLIEDRRLAFRLDGLVWRDGRLAIAQAAVTGAPVLADHGTAPPRRLALGGLAVAARSVTWPPRGPVLVELDAALPEAGTLQLRARLGLAARTGDLSIIVRDAALHGVQDWLVVTGPIGGAVDAELRGTVGWESGLALDLGGGVRGRDLTLGPPERPPIGIAGVDLGGVTVRWPGEIRVARLGIRGLSGLVEREPDGRLPLGALLAPRRHAAADAAVAPGSAGPSRPPGSSAPPVAVPAAPGRPTAPAGTATVPAAGAGFQPVVRIDEVALEDGTLRFVDRGTTPFYSEEVSRLALRARGLTTASEGQAALTVQGTVGGTGTLDLTGRVAPFARPFFLEVQGELREFELPRTNPVFRRLFAWLFKRGSLTTRLHYRIVGDQLEALNDVQLEGLGVERDPGSETTRRVGVPLGLLVAIATDAHGDITFPVPVRGRLGSPEFSLGGAIWAAVRNAVLNLVAGPVNAIGRLFQPEGKEPTVRIDPLEFATGVAVLTADGDRHLQRVADFLRAAPNAALELRAVVTDTDLLSLGTQAVVARVQRLQREQALDSFPAAAARLFHELLPGRPVPGTVEEIVETLREREPLPAAAVAQLAARRLETARDALVTRSGIVAGRLRVPAAAPARGGPGTGRIEFELAP